MSCIFSYNNSFLKRSVDLGHTTANAIQQDDAYFYLQEVIPPAMPLKNAMAARQRKTAEAKGDVVPPLVEQPAEQPTTTQEGTTMDIDDQRASASEQAAAASSS